MSQTMKFRTIMYLFFLTPCLFALTGSGEEQTVAVVLSMLLTGFLGCIYLGVDFMDAIHANTTKFVWPKRTITSVLVMSVCTVVFWWLVLGMIFG